MNPQAALNVLYELRAVLDRLGGNNDTLQQAMADDIDRAVRLTDECIALLTGEEGGAGAGAGGEMEG